MLNRHPKRPSAFGSAPTLFKVFFVSVFVIVFFIFIAVISVNGYFAYKASQLDWDHGVKGVVEQVWYGKENQQNSLTPEK